MIFGSLFSGIGGMDLGLERAGMRCAWQCEIDPWRRSILAKHWPEVPKHEDVLEIALRPWVVADVDLVAGGFPCQDVSDAHTSSRRLGLRGKRSSLWSRMMEVINGVRPRFVIAENVGAWRRWVPDVRSDLAKAGYPSLPVALCSCVLGARHHRRRVFVLADAHGEGQSLRTIHAKVASLSPVSGCSGDWWEPPPGIVRLDDGVPCGMVQRRAYGDSVAPPMAQWIGELLLGALESGDTSAWSRRVP